MCIDLLRHWGWPEVKDLEGSLLGSEHYVAVTGHEKTAKTVATRDWTDTALKKIRRLSGGSNTEHVRYSDTALKN